MSKIDELKIMLTVWHRNRSVSEASDICTWLYGELIGGDDGKTTDATPKQNKIGSKS